jgi:hypothetical protein
VSTTGTTTFTRSHARDIAAKIAADLRQMNHHYGQPTLADIPKYLEEIIELLTAGYLRSFEDGWENSDGHRVVSLRYEVRDDGSISDGRAGGVYAHADVQNATHFNFVNYTQKFLNLPQADRDAFKAKLPIKRTPGSDRSDGNGYWEVDRGYASGGVGAERKTFRPL